MRQNFLPGRHADKRRPRVRRFRHRQRGSPLSGGSQERSAVAICPSRLTRGAPVPEGKCPPLFGVGRAPSILKANDKPANADAGLATHLPLASPRAAPRTAFGWRLHQPSNAVRYPQSPLSCCPGFPGPSVVCQWAVIAIGRERTKPTMLRRRPLLRQRGAGYAAAADLWGATDGGGAKPG